MVMEKLYFNAFAFKSYCANTVKFTHGSHSWLCLKWRKSDVCMRAGLKVTVAKQ